MNADFLCICGHAYKEHESLEVCEVYEYCKTCYNRYGENRGNHEFVGDNLKSLEILSK